MTKGSRKRSPAEIAWREGVTERIRDLLSAMGTPHAWLARKLAPRLGIKEGSAGAHFKRQFTAFSIFHVSDILGISLDYLMKENVPLKTAVIIDGAYDHFTTKKELKELRAQLKASQKATARRTKKPKDVA